MRDSQAVEDARRALGRQLAAYRRAAGYSQTRLAALLYCSRSTIANVETGRQHALGPFWARADDVLQAHGALTEADHRTEAAARRERYAAVQAARQLSPGLAPIAAGPNGDAGDDDPGCWPDSFDQARTTAAALWSGGDTTSPEPPGRTAVPGAALALRWLVAPPDVSAGRREGWRPLTAGDLDRLRGVRRGLKEIDNAHGGGAVLPMAMSYVRSELPRLLECRYDEVTGRRLLEIAAEFQLDIGWMAYDAAQQALAGRYFAYALRFSHAAGNRLLGGRILAAMSHQAIYLGDIQRAVDLVRAARWGTRQVATPRAAAMLAAMEACAQAAAGDARLSRAALGDAEDALASETGEQEPDWLDFDEGGYWGHAARAYRDLGEPGEAGRCAQRSVALCRAGHSRTRAQRTAIEATAQLRLGDVEAAAVMGERIVGEAWNLHSGHVFADVAALAAAIEPYRARAAASFVEQARELLVARAAAVSVAGG